MMAKIKLTPQNQLKILKNIQKAEEQGFSKEQIDETLKNDVGMSYSDFSGSVRSLSNILATINQGLTLGYWDEARAGIDSLFGGDYEKSLERERARVDALKTQNPILSASLEIAGAIPTAFIPGTTALKGGNLLQKAGASALVGATEGGAYGFGKGEGGLKERAESAKSGAAGGAIGGGAGRVGIEALSPVGRSLARTVTGRDPIKFQTRKALREDLINQEGTPEQILRRAREVSPVQKESMLVADLTPTTQDYTRALANLPTAARKQVIDKLESRQKDVVGRVDKSIDNILGEVKLQDSIGDEIVTITQRLKAQADPNYDEIRKTIDLSTEGIEKLPTATKNKLEEILKRPLIKESIELAKKDLKNTGDFKGEDSVMSWSVLDRTKRMLDDKIQNGYEPITGKFNGQARTALKVKKDLLAVMDSKSVDPKGLYKTARSIYEDDAKIKTAIESGYEYFRARSARKAWNAKEALSTMTESQKQAFLRGIAYSLKDMVLESPQTANNARKIFQGTKQELLRSVFKNNPKKFKEFEKFVNDELDMFTTFSQSLTGSRTANLERSMNDLDKKIGGLGVFNNAQDAALAVIRILGKRDEKITREKLAKELQKILMTPVENIDEIEKFLRGSKGDKLYELITSITPPVLERTSQRGGALLGTKFTEE
tara:strand:- start:180 stop:2162 length:1983 start_codon:yes stop_codon:yes gene_type:complete